MSKARSSWPTSYWTSYRIFNISLRCFATSADSCCQGAFENLDISLQEKSKKTCSQSNPIYVQHCLDMSVLCLARQSALAENKNVIDYSKKLFLCNLLYFPWTFIPCGGLKKKKAIKFSKTFPMERWGLFLLSLNLSWLVIASTNEIGQKWYYVTSQTRSERQWSFCLIHWDAYFWSLTSMYKV